jgi:hypothetical protein
MMDWELYHAAKAVAESMVAWFVFIQVTLTVLRMMGVCSG